MAKETEFNPTKLMEIPTQSKIGKLVNVTKYEDFETIIKTSDNVADLFGEVEKQIAIALGCEQFSVELHDNVISHFYKVKKLLLITQL